MALLRKVFLLLLLLYGVATLPLVALFLFHPNLQFRLLDKAAQVYQDFVAPPRIALAGDSHTGEGRNWGPRLGLPFYRLRNLGQNGAIIRQIAWQAQGVHAEIIHLCGGTNDAFFFPDRPVSEFLADYEALLQVAGRQARVIVTLAPLTAHEELNRKITLYNQGIQRLCASHGIPCLDLNPEIAPQGLLDSRFSHDGFHLNEAGYALWGNRLKPLLQTP